MSHLDDIEIRYIRDLMVYYFKQGWTCRQSLYKRLLERHYPARQIGLAFFMLEASGRVEKITRGHYQLAKTDTKEQC